MKSIIKFSYQNNMRASKAIYGIILMFVLLAGLDHITDESSLGIAIKLILGALSITFAEIYSEIIGERIAKKSKLSSLEKRAIYNDAFAIISVSIIPCLVFLLATTTFIETELAFTVSYIYFLSMLFMFNYYAAITSSVPRFKSFLYALVTLMIGCLVILIKYIFGH